MEYLGIHSTRRTENGEFISITFETDAGTHEVVVTPDNLNDILVICAGLIGAARKVINPGAIVPATVPKGFQVRPAKSQNSVFMRFETEQGLHYTFGFSTKTARLLQNAIDSACAQCERKNP